MSCRLPQGQSAGPNRLLYRLSTCSKFDIHLTKILKYIILRVMFFVFGLVATNGGKGMATRVIVEDGELVVEEICIDRRELDLIIGRAEKKGLRYYKKRIPGGHANDKGCRDRRPYRRPMAFAAVRR